jgi:hypothetical protein
MKFFPTLFPAWLIRFAGVVLGSVAVAASLAGSAGAADNASETWQTGTNVKPLLVFSAQAETPKTLGERGWKPVYRPAPNAPLVVTEVFQRDGKVAFLLSDGKAMYVGDSLAVVGAASVGHDDQAKCVLQGIEFTKEQRSTFFVKYDRPEFHYSRTFKTCLAFTGATISDQLPETKSVLVNKMVTDIYTNKIIASTQYNEDKDSGKRVHRSYPEANNNYYTPDKFEAMKKKLASS